MKKLFAALVLLGMVSSITAAFAYWPGPRSGDGGRWNRWHSDGRTRERPYGWRYSEGRRGGYRNTEMPRAWRGGYYPGYGTTWYYYSR